MKQYPGLFSRYTPLNGKDWLRRISTEDRAAFSNIGQQFAEHGRLGGVARARSAPRCSCGRFVSQAQALEHGTCWHTLEHHDQDTVLTRSKCD